MSGPTFAHHEIALGDEWYPECLLLTPRPPKTLYVAGDPAALVEGMGVIGARKATPYGLKCASLFAGWAAARGVTIVSGAAIGCDQAAQRAALASGGRTVAVLGCGADVDYPAGAADMLRQVRRSGAVVSELPWGSEPHRGAFPARNRIIAGLSKAVLVVEARLPSGTFSTVDHALEASREVWAVPGSIFAPECRGPNRLLSQGSTPISSVSELAAGLENVGLLGPDARTHGLGEMTVDATDPVARALIADPSRPDDLAHDLGLDIIDVMRRIARLEAAGIARRFPDGRYGHA